MIQIKRIHQSLLMIVLLRNVLSAQCAVDLLWRCSVFFFILFQFPSSVICLLTQPVFSVSLALSMFTSLPLILIAFVLFCSISWFLNFDWIYRNMVVSDCNFICISSASPLAITSYSLFAFSNFQFLRLSITILRNFFFIWVETHSHKHTFSHWSITFTLCVYHLSLSV